MWFNLPQPARGWRFRVALALAAMAGGGEMANAGEVREIGFWREEREVAGRWQWVQVHEWRDPETGLSYTTYHGTDDRELPPEVQARFRVEPPAAGIMSVAGSTGSEPAAVSRRRQVQRPAVLKANMARTSRSKFSPGPSAGRLGQLTPAESTRFAENQARVELAAMAGEGKLHLIGLVRDLDEPLVFLGPNLNVPWQGAGDGGLAARVGVGSAGAAEMRVLWRGNLPEGAVISQLDADGNLAANALGPEDLAALGEHWSGSVPGDAVELEVYLPPGVDPGAASLDLRVAALGHKVPEALAAARGTTMTPKGSTPTNGEGSCHNNAGCAEYNDWNDQADSVALVEFVHSTYGLSTCSGALLNDINTVTTRPYFLTANHCINDSGEASSSEYYWKFEATTCSGTASRSSALRTTGGAAILATRPLSTGTDFTLLELNTAPPAAARYSGWSNSTLSANADVTSIHHPQGAYKRITFGDRTAAAPSENLWEVVWESGTTNGGSSGAPLYNAAKQVVGQLYGGGASCANLSAPDYYGRFDKTYPYVSSYLVTPYTGIPVITTQPLAAEIPTGTSTSMVVAAQGGGLSFQWRIGTPPGGTNVTGATSATYTTPALGATTTYYVRVSNSYGATDSAAATVTVKAPPSITQQPQGQDILTGEAASFTAEATGAAPLTYQWFRGSTPGSGGTQVGTNSVAYITGALSTTTSYWLRVRNQIGGATYEAVSQLATATVFPNTFARWATQQGIPGAARGGDPDYDGIPNEMEYVLQMDPLAESSSGLPQPRFTEGGGQPMIQFTLPPDFPSGGTVQVQTTEDFTSWLPATVLIQGGVVTATAGAAGDPARYFKILTSLP